MKLKEAIKAAGAEGFTHVAVARNGAIYAFKEAPIFFGNQWCAVHSGRFKLEGRYTGKKNWRCTLREVKGKAK